MTTTPFGSRTKAPGPRLFGQRVDDLVAAPASLCVGHIDVVDVHADRRVLGRGGIPGHEADLDRTVLGERKLATQPRSNCFRRPRKST